MLSHLAHPDIRNQTSFGKASETFNSPESFLNHPPTSENQDTEIREICLIRDLNN